MKLKAILLALSLALFIAGAFTHCKDKNEYAGIPCLGALQSDKNNFFEKLFTADSDDSDAAPLECAAVALALQSAATGSCNPMTGTGCNALTLSGPVSTFAGSTSSSSGTSDGTGTAARFNSPAGMVSDGTNLFVADYGNHAIRKIVIATGEVSTVAGNKGTSGSADGTGTAATFNSPQGIATDGTNLYVAEYSNHTIRKIVIATGVTTTLAGTAGSNASTDGTGAAARFWNPVGLNIDKDLANLYIYEQGSGRVRKLNISTAVVTTPAGQASAGYADGTGTAANFLVPQDGWHDGTNLYVADTNNESIRKMVTATTAVSTYAGQAGSNSFLDGVGTAARFFVPAGITSDWTNIYVTDSDRIRKIDLATGTVSTLAPTGLGTGSPTYGHVDGDFATARFRLPKGIATDGTHLYISDQGNHVIRKIE